MSYLTTGWLCVISGSLFVAIGGLLTTKGWVEFSNHSKRQTLIKCAVLELDQNIKYLDDMDKCFEHISDLDQVYLLPTFNLNTIQSIQTSPLFSKDSDLLVATSSFLYNVNPVNNSVLKLNNEFSGTTSTLDQKKNTYISFHETSLMTRFRQKQDVLYKQLLELN